MVSENMRGTATGNVDIANEYGQHLTVDSGAVQGFHACNYLFELAEGFCNEVNMVVT